MKKQIFAVLAMVLALTLFLSPGQALAETTQGQVALSLANILGLSAATQEDAIAALNALGITPEGGWEINETASPSFVGDLYGEVNTAIADDKITPPAPFENASALVAAACVGAGMPSASAVNAIVNAGGDRDSANAGATAIISGGIRLTPPIGEGADTDLFPDEPEPGSGAGAGGGGGVGTQSR